MLEVQPFNTPFFGWFRATDGERERLGRARGGGGGGLVVVVVVRE